MLAAVPAPRPASPRSGSSSRRCSGSRGGRRWTPSSPRAPYEQEHFRAGLEGRAAPTREERDREQALLAHELTLIAEAPCTPDQLTVPRLVGRGTLSAGWRVRRRPTACATSSTASWSRSRTRATPRTACSRRASPTSPGASSALGTTTASARRRTPRRRRCAGGAADPRAHRLASRASTASSTSSSPSTPWSPTTVGAGVAHATTRRRRRWPTTRRTPSTLLDGRRATVVGHSYGGVVGLMTAVQRPDLVASLAVFEPTVPFTDWWPDHDEMMRRSARPQAHVQAVERGHARRTPEQRAADDDVDGARLLVRRDRAVRLRRRHRAVPGRWQRRHHAVGLRVGRPARDDARRRLVVVPRTPATPCTAPTRASSPTSPAERSRSRAERAEPSRRAGRRSDDLDLRTTSAGTAPRRRCG